MTQTLAKAKKAVNNKHSKGERASELGNARRWRSMSGRRQASAHATRDAYCQRARRGQFVTGSMSARAGAVPPVHGWAGCDGGRSDQGPSRR